MVIEESAELDRGLHGTKGTYGVLCYFFLPILTITKLKRTNNPPNNSDLIPSTRIQLLCFFLRLK